MKLRKKRKKDKINKYNLRKSLLILVMLICITIAMITYWIYAYHHKYGTFYFDDIKLVSHKINDYLDIKGDVVYLKNMPEEFINNFTNNQQDVIDNNNVISVDIKKELKGNYLSIMINYSLAGVNTKEEVLSINIDLKQDKIITNDELLDMVGTSYKNIATDIFNEYIKLANDSNKMVTDAITGTKLTSKEFNNNSEKYIIRIREKLPDIINLYIEDGKLNYTLNLEEIYKVCYYTNTNKLVNLNNQLGQI